jgi:hypothetical protein
MCKTSNAFGRKRGGESTFGTTEGDLMTTQHADNQNQTENENGRRFACDRCPAAFLNERDLMMHRQLEHHVATEKGGNRDLGVWAGSTWRELALKRRTGLARP